MDKFVRGSLIAGGLSLLLLGGAVSASVAASAEGKSATAALAYSSEALSSDISAARKAKRAGRKTAHRKRINRARAERRYGRGAPPAYGRAYGAAPAYGPAAAIYPGALRFGDPGYDTVGSIYYGPGAGPYGTNRVTGEVYSKCYTDEGYGRVQPCDQGGGGGGLN